MTNILDGVAVAVVLIAAGVFTALYAKFKLHLRPQRTVAYFTYALIYARFAVPFFWGSGSGLTLSRWLFFGLAGALFAFIEFERMPQLRVTKIPLPVHVAGRGDKVAMREKPAKKGFVNPAKKPLYTYSGRGDSLWEL